MSISNLCDCDNGLVSISHDPCAAVDYGNRFVAAMLQKPEGTPFDGTASNDVTVAADINAKIALAGTDDSKLAIIPRLNLVFPPVAPSFLATNESASGKQEAIEFEFSGNAFLQYVSEATFAQIEQYTFCAGQLRVWLVTNTGWLFGNGSQTSATAQNGYEFLTISHETPAFEGAGTKGARIPIHFHGIDKCWLKPVIQSADYLRLTETGISV